MIRSMKRYFRFFRPMTLTFCAVVMVSCSRSKPTTNHLVASKTFILDGQLEEISGLSSSINPNTLLAVNDEEEVRFHLSKVTGQIMTKEVFSGPGDYEGVDHTKNATLILKSNGELITHSQRTSEDRYNTGLSSENNAEGLMRNPMNDSEVWVALKGQAFVSKDPTTREILAFSLKEKKLKHEAVVTLPRSELMRRLQEQYSRLSIAQRSPLRRRLTKFAPSGLAYDHVRKELLVLSAEGQSLVTFDRMRRQIQSIYFFDTSRLPKPEGLAVDSNGGWWVASEGVDGPARLAYFEPRKVEPTF